MMSQLVWKQKMKLKEKWMENNAPQEIVYTKAKLGRRMAGHFFDLGILFLATSILVSIVNMIVINTGWYKGKEADLVAMRNESKLYDDGVVISEVAADDTTFPSYENKKDYLSVRIDEFYHSPTYFKDLTIWDEYGERKLNAVEENVHLFVKNGDKIVENNVSHELLYNFYKAEVDDHALAYLMTNVDYFNLTRLQFWTIIIEIIVLTTLMFTFFYLIFPLVIFKRGRQTIGMKLEKIALISYRAVNVTGGKYVLRFLFMYAVFIPLNFVSFLIPSLVSTTMMYFSKTNSSLPNYVFNDYMVDITNQEIYLNELEREYKEEERKKISLENRDLTLK